MNSNFAHKLSGLALALLATLALPVYADSAATTASGSEAGSMADSQASSEAPDALMGGLGPYFAPNPTLWGNDNWGLREAYNEMGNPFAEPAAAPAGASFLPAYGGGGIRIYGISPSYTMQAYGKILPRRSVSDLLRRRKLK